MSGKMSDGTKSGSNHFLVGFYLRFLHREISIHKMSPSVRFFATVRRTAFQERPFGNIRDPLKGPLKSIKHHGNTEGASRKPTVYRWLYCIREAGVSPMTITKNSSKARFANIRQTFTFLYPIYIYIYFNLRTIS